MKWRQKGSKVEEKLQQGLGKSEKSSAFYKRFKDLARKAARMNKKHLRGPQKNKSFSEYTQRHRSRIKMQLRVKYYSTLPLIGEYDFIATKVEIFSSETQGYDTLRLIDENELPFTENNPKTLNSDEINDINLWIYIKDKYNISDQAQKELAMKTDMRNAYRIKENIAELNSKQKLKLTPGDPEGVQTSLNDSLKKQIQRLKIKGDLCEQKTGKVKLSGHGTNIGKRLKVVNTYTILNEKENARSEKGNSVLAIIKTKETYDNLKETLSDIKTEMAQLNEIEVDNVEYFLGGDWNALLAFVAQVLQTKIMHAFGANVEGTKGIM